jgi:alpha-L-fucosidase
MNNNPRSQWYPEAGLGLYIDFGVYGFDLTEAFKKNMNCGVIGNSFKWIDGSRERVINGSCDHSPSWNINYMVSSACKSGFRYALMTTQYPNGRDMWPSHNGVADSESELEQRDLVLPFIESCRRYGIKVGLSYKASDSHSSAQSVEQVTQLNPVTQRPTKKDEAVANIMESRDSCDMLVQNGIKNHKSRIRDLLTRYGRIDILVVHGGCYDIEIYNIAKSLQPHIVLNELDGIGDFSSDNLGMGSLLKDRWHESHCDFMDTDINKMLGVYGSESITSVAIMIERLIRLRSHGSNMVVNVGTDVLGNVPMIFGDWLDELGAWMSWASPSIVGTIPCPMSYRSNVPITQNETMFFLHIMPGWSGSVYIDGVESVDVHRCFFMHTSEAVVFVQSGIRITINDIKNHGSLPFIICCLLKQGI